MRNYVLISSVASRHIVLVFPPWDGEILILFVEVGIPPSFESHNMRISAGLSRMMLLIGQTAVLIFFTNAYGPVTQEKNGNDNIQFVPTGYIYS